MSCHVKSNTVAVMSCHVKSNTVAARCHFMHACILYVHFTINNS